MVHSPAEVVRPLRRNEYDALVALGVFQDERVELLDGSLVAMSPVGQPHSSAVQKLTELLLPGLLGRATVRVQSPFAAHDLSEPDLSLRAPSRPRSDAEPGSLRRLAASRCRFSEVAKRGTRTKLQRE